MTKKLIDQLREAHSTSITEQEAALYTRAIARIEELEELSANLTGLVIEYRDSLSDHGLINCYQPQRAHVRLAC